MPADAEQLALITTPVATHHIGIARFRLDQKIDATSQPDRTLAQTFSKHALLNGGENRSDSKIGSQVVGDCCGDLRRDEFFSDAVNPLHANRKTLVLTGFD